MLRLLNLCILFVLVSCIETFAQHEHYFSKVAIPLHSNISIQTIGKLGLEVDHGYVNPTNELELILSDEEQRLLDEQSISYQILIPDMEAFYYKRKRLELQDPKAQAILAASSSRTADAFGYGSMGGFYTWDEVIAKMDEMEANYPNLVKAKTQIGTSFEGRPIYAYKISDNPDTDESATEGVVYFDALHHAREPMSMSTLINFSFHLLENYNSDPEITYLVNNREFHFIPVVNPDGYVHNETTNPDGGGLWRKNRRNDTTSCVSAYGVDLNRNYSVGWGNPIGSSSNNCSNTYHGTGAFSEPETQAVKAYIDALTPDASFSVHAFNGSTLIPLGDSDTADDYPLYSELSMELYDENNYLYGLAIDVINYYGSGMACDYHHEENGAISWIPEIGGSGFWPSQTQIFGLVDENINPMKKLGWLAGGMADLQSHKLIGQIAPSTTANLEIELKNKGVSKTASNVVVELESLNPNVTILNNNQSFGNIISRGLKSNANNPFQLNISSSAQIDEEVEMDIVVKQGGIEVDRERIFLYVGYRNTLFSDDGENGFNEWITNGSHSDWELTTDDAYSETQSFTDSKNGSHANNAIDFIELKNSLDLTGTENPKAEFMAKWSFDPNIDYGRFYVSTNGGSSWSTLASDYTINISNTPSYTANKNWVHVIVDLSSYKTNDVKFRFGVISNGSRASDGFYFDDFSIIDYRSCPIFPTAKIYVDKDATGTGYGDSWENALITLDLAFAAADCNPDVDTIWIAGDTYKTDESGSDRNKFFEINRGLHIFGGFNGSETRLDQRFISIFKTIISGNIGNSVIDSDNANTIFRVTSSDTCTIDGLYIRNGYRSSFTTSNYSSAINNFGKLKLKNTTIENCYSIYPGTGLYNRGSGAKLIIENCTIKNLSGSDRWINNVLGAAIEMKGNIYIQE